MQSALDAPVPPPRCSTISLIGKATAALVVLLAFGAFLLSFEALRDLAVTSGALNDTHAWVFPLIVDGSIVIFSLSALRASLAGEDRRWYMALVVVVTLASVGFNIAHARGGLLSGVMAAMPPVLLFCAFESLMRQVYSLVAPTTLPTMRPAKKAKKQGEVADPLASDTEKRRVTVSGLLEQGLSRNAIARKLGVSPATIRRDLRHLALTDLKAA